MADRICIVNHNVDESEYRERHSCKTGRHRHISLGKMEEAVHRGFIEPPAQGSAGDTEPKPDYLLEWLVPGGVLRYRRDVPLRGLTSKVGEYHANGIVTKEDWALAMLRQMQMRREPTGTVNTGGTLAGGGANRVIVQYSGSARH